MALLVPCASAANKADIWLKRILLQVDGKAKELAGNVRENTTGKYQPPSYSPNLQKFSLHTHHFMHCG